MGFSLFRCPDDRLLTNSDVHSLGYILLFCDTQAGANANVVIFTLLETAKANGLNPEAYLNHLLTLLPERFADDPQAVIDDLMPWNQKMQRAFMSEISDADH